MKKSPSPINIETAKSVNLRPGDMEDAALLWRNSETLAALVDFLFSGIENRPAS